MEKKEKYNFEEIFATYITNLVEITFGFTPKVRIQIPCVGKVAVILDGSDAERCKMMGKDANNLKAMKMLLRAYSNRYDIFSYLYVAPYDFYSEYEAQIK